MKHCPILKKTCITEQYVCYKTYTDLGGSHAECRYLKCGVK